MDRRRAGALVALAACIACSAAAPTASNHTALDLYDGTPEGCYYNFQHYGEGDRIMTNEPCLNCTCHNRMLMCYLRVCPFTKPIGQDCTIEKRADQCCPIVTCPDVPVDLLTSTSTSSPAEYGATGIGKLDKYGCSINGKYFPEGSKVPPTPNKPCEHCYCIRNMTTCVMQECTLHVDGCTPIYHKDVCCPVRYSCDHPEDEMLLLDDMSTTVRPTPGYLLTTTTVSPVTQMTQDCVHDDKVFADGALIKTEKACEHCYCMKGDIVCVVQECGTPMENEGKNCTSLPPREGQCCPDTYICEGDELGTELPADLTTESVIDTLTTLMPPRRGGDEGSGYRKEPGEVPHSQLTTTQSEYEGSGEEQATITPLDTTEKQPIDTTEDGQYQYYTTKSPLFAESDATTVDGISEEIVEPEEYIPAITNAPVERGDDTTEDGQNQEIFTEKEDLKPHEAISTTLISESYDRVTTEPGEAYNTVPDSISEYVEPHKHIPITSITKTEEDAKTTPSIKQQDITTDRMMISEDESTKLEYPSTPANDKTSQPTKEHDLISHDLTTEKESSEAEQYSPISPITDDIEKVAPESHEDVTSLYDSKEKGDLESNIHISSTMIIPTEKDVETTTEPDHDLNTVAVVEEDHIHPHIHATLTTTSLKEEERTTVHSLELGSGAEDTTEEVMLVPHEHAATESAFEKESTQTTAEPDKGFDTIPGKISEESTSEGAMPQKTTISQETEVTESDDTRRTESKPTIASEAASLTPGYTVSRGDQYTGTTEPSFRKEDESSISTEKPKDADATTGKIDFTDEEFIPTSIHDKKQSTGSPVQPIEQDFTTSLPDNVIESKEPTTETILQSSISSEILPEKLPEHPTEQGIQTTEKISEITTVIAEVEAHEHPGRIPGEGDCLLNGITYNNNSVVPSTNNCHSGCKCVSSIIKCDPIICSPPPDYMDNCQSMYDSPDSCCPTYVCDHPRETVPPQSDNQMSGTESPIPSPAIECNGDQCEITVVTKQPEEFIKKPEGNECGPDGCDSIMLKPVDSEHPEGCTDGKCIPSSDDCTTGNCEVPTTHDVVCDPKHGCQTMPLQPCEGEYCKGVEDHPPKLCDSKGDCHDVTSCEGDSCKFEVSPPQDTQQTPCHEADGCKSEQSIPQECTEESCKKSETPEVEYKPSSECEGSQCIPPTETVSGIDHLSTESSVKETTPVETITEKHKPIEYEQTEGPLVAVTEQQPGIQEAQKEITTLLPDTLSNEIVSETESPERSQEKTTTVIGAANDEKSPQTTEGYRVTQIADSQTIEPDLLIPAHDKDSTQTTEKDKLPEVYVTEPQQLVTETDEQTVSLESTEPTLQIEKDEKTPSSEQKLPVSDNVVHGYTTVSYGNEAAMITGAHEFTESDEARTQTTMSSIEFESSTGTPLYKLTTHETSTEELLHYSKIPEISEAVSKTTDATTEEDYYITDTPEYGLPVSKPHEIEPVKIEPQDGITESEKSPTLVEESTTLKSEIYEHITEGDQIRVDVPRVTDVSATESTPAKQSAQDSGSTPEMKESVTDLPLASTIEPDRKFTEIEDAYLTGQDQTTTEQSLSSEAKATTLIHDLDKSTYIIESSTTEKLHDVVEISLPSSEKPMRPDSQTGGVTEPQQILTEYDFTEKHEEISTKQPILPEKDTSEPPLVIDKQEITTETFAPETSEEKLTGEISDYEKPEADNKDLPASPVTEKEMLEISGDFYTESQAFITKKPITITDQTSEVATKTPILATSGQEEEMTEVAKSTATEAAGITESPIHTVPGESSVPVEDFTIQEEKATNISEIQDIQKHLTTKVPEELITLQEIGTEIPHKYPKIPEVHATESYDVNPDDISTKSQEQYKPYVTESYAFSTEEQTPLDEHKQFTDSLITADEMRTELTTKTPETFTTKQQDFIGTTLALPVVTKDAVIEPGFTEIPQTTQSQEIYTKSPEAHVSEKEEDQTELPVRRVTEPEIFEHDKTITETPEVIKETDLQESVTKPSDDVQESETEVSKQDEITKSPEYTQQLELETIEYNEAVTKIPEDTTKSKPEEVTLQALSTNAPGIGESEPHVTAAPEVNAGSKLEVTGPLDDTTKASENTQQSELGITIYEEVTRTPEHAKPLELEVTGHTEEELKAPDETTPSVTEAISLDRVTTKAPEVPKDSQQNVSHQEEEVTKVPTSMQPVTEIVGEKITQSPDDLLSPEVTKQEKEVTKLPEDSKESIPKVTKYAEEVTQSPADMKESLPEVTKYEEEVTKSPEDLKDTLLEDTKHEEKLTESPEVTKETLPEVTKHDEEVTKSPEETSETLLEVSKHDKEITKSPEDMKESQPEFTKHEEIVTKSPEETKEPLPEVSEHEEAVTKSPESTEDSATKVSEHEKEVTISTEGMEESVPEVTKHDEEVTKSPKDTKESVPEVSEHKKEVTKSPEGTEESVPEVSKYDEEVTKSPEGTEETVTEVTKYKDEASKSPEDTKESLPEVTKYDEEVTKSPEDAKESLPEVTKYDEEVTKSPEGTEETVTEVTKHEEEASKSPEDTKESLPEVTKHDEEVTKSPEETSETLLEVSKHDKEITKSPEDMKESQPEFTKHEEIVTKSPEETKEPLPEVSEHEEAVTKSPESTEDSATKVSEHEKEVTISTEGMEESVPEVTKHDEEVTKSPEDTKESVPEVSEHKKEVTKSPEGTEESVPEVSKYDEEVTKSPEGTEETVTEVTKHEDEASKSPEHTKESLPEVTKYDEEVTKSPEDTKESVPEVTIHEAEVTKSPEDAKESLPEVTKYDEEVTKSPEDVKELVSEVTKQDEEVTQSPESTEESVPEVTKYDEEVTKSPEDTKESVPEVTKHDDEVIKSPEDMKESVPEVSEHKEEVTKSPEGTEESVPEVTKYDEDVTKSPEDTNESLPEVSKHDEEITISPEDSNEPLPEVTDHEEKVTIPSDDTKETLPEITKYDEEVTKSPEDTKESILEVTKHEEEVTTSPDDTNESLPEITAQEKGVTNVPEGSKDSLSTITGHEDVVTEGPEETKESLPEIPKHDEEVTKSPEDIIESISEVTKHEEEVTKSPEHPKEPIAEVTKHEEEVTKSPDDNKELLPGITAQEDRATESPEATKESSPDISEQEEGVTKAPEETKETVPVVIGLDDGATKSPEETKESIPEISEQEEIITQAPGDTKEQESLPHVTSQEETVTQTPEFVQGLQPQVTELTPDDIVTDKQETITSSPDRHVPPEIITTLRPTEYTTTKLIENVATEQPTDKFSETTPDVIILEEHTHNILEDISTVSPSNGERTTAYIDTEIALSEPSSEKPIQEDVEIATQKAEITTTANEELFTVSGSPISQPTLVSMDHVTERIPESSFPTEETLTDHKHDVTIDEKESTSTLATEQTPVVSVDLQKLPTPDTEQQTEKIPTITDKPAQHEILHQTTVPQDELPIDTTKATTIKQEEEITTPAADDKLTKPEDKPIESSEIVPSANVPESPKPIDELPTPEEDSHFPSSGMSGYGEPDYVEEDQTFSPGTCRYGGKVYVSAQQIPRDDPCDFCFCFRSDIICLQQSCPPPIHGCHEEPIQGFCCPRYECPVSMATTVNVTTTTTTTTTTLPPHFPTHSYKGAAQRRGCQIKGRTYKVGEVVRSASGPCLHCTCGGDGQMKCDPKACTPEPMLRQMIAAAVSAKRRR